MVTTQSLLTHCWLQWPPSAGVAPVFHIPRFCQAEPLCACDQVMWPPGGVGASGALSWCVRSPGAESHHTGARHGAGASGIRPRTLTAVTEVDAVHWTLDKHTLIIIFLIFWVRLIHLPCVVLRLTNSDNFAEKIRCDSGLDPIDCKSSPSPKSSLPRPNPDPKPKEVPKPKVQLGLGVTQ